LLFGVQLIMLLGAAATLGDTITLVIPVFLRSLVRTMYITNFLSLSLPFPPQGLTYDQAQAAINGTVTLQLPNWLEVLLHHANYHLPSHVSISIPSYNLKGAQQYLQQRLVKYLTIAQPNAQLLRNLMTAWLVYDVQQQRYVDFDQAEELVQQYKQQQQQQGELASAAGNSSSSSSSSSSNGAEVIGSSSSSNGATPSSSLQPQQVRQHSNSPAAAFGV
jgi:fatty acid desaturase